MPGRPCGRQLEALVDGPAIAAARLEHAASRSPRTSSRRERMPQTSVSSFDLFGRSWGSRQEFECDNKHPQQVREDRHPLQQPTRPAAGRGEGRSRGTGHEDYDEARKRVARERRLADLPKPDAQQGDGDHRREGVQPRKNDMHGARGSHRRATRVLRKEDGGEAEDARDGKRTPATQSASCPSLPRRSSSAAPYAEIRRTSCA